MEIKPIIIRESPGIVGLPSPSVGKEVNGQGDSQAFREADALKALLQEEPAVRSGMVEQARKLIGENSWPPALAIRQISNLLAVNLHAIN